MTISTTITRKFFDMKMQDLERDGYFYEYKEDKPYWQKRINNLIQVTGDGCIKLVPTDIVFLVGNKPHRFKVEQISYTTTVPERYASAIKTDFAYAIKCVKQEITA